MRKLIVVLAVLAVASIAQADLLISGPGYSYSQNFDTLASTGTANSWTDNTTLNGWYWQSPSTRNPGTYGYISDSGSSTTGAGHTYGTDSDRALGALSGSSGVDLYWGLQLQNNSGSAISLADILIDYWGEQWRQTANSQNIDFSYQISDTRMTNFTEGAWTDRNALDFTCLHTAASASSLNGNDATNRTQFSDVSLDTSGTLNNNQYLMLRWVKTGTTSPGEGVDDFALDVIPEPSAMILVGIGFLGLLLRRKMLR